MANALKVTGVAMACLGAGVYAFGSQLGGAGWEVVGMLVGLPGLLVFAAGRFVADRKR